jgi:hypothetical protein
VQTQGWDETGTKPKHHGHMEFEWYDLGPKDLLAVEIGVFHAYEDANNFKRQVWPNTFEALAAPEPDEWERNKTFAIPNPPSSPWSGWDELYIDPTARIGPKTWVAGFEVSGGLRRPIIGPVRNLRQRFTVSDARTGKEVTLGSDHAVYFGAVMGMSKNCLDRKERKRAATAEMEKVAKKGKRSPKAHG